MTSILSKRINGKVAEVYLHNDRTTIEIHYDNECIEKRSDSACRKMRFDGTLEHYLDTVVELYIKESSFNNAFNNTKGEW